MTNDLEGLKRLQRKLRFEQFEKRKALPGQIYATLKSDEYIYFSDIIRPSYYDELGKAYVIADKRLIRFEKKQILEIPWQDIVSVEELKEKRGFFSSSLEFAVNTFNGDTVFSFSADAYGSLREQIIHAEHCDHFREEIIRILQMHNTRYKDPLVQICFAQLGQEFDFELAEDQIKDLLVKYTKRYPHNPEGVLEVHIERKMKEGKTRVQAIKELKDENQ